MSFDHSDHPAPALIPLHFGCRRNKPTFEVPRQCQGQRNTTLIQFPVHILPCRYQHNSFGSITARRLEYRVDILSTIRVPRSLVLVFLPGSFQSSRGKDFAQLFGNPIQGYI